jgi:hypothetical protein
MLTEVGLHRVAFEIDGFDNSRRSGWSVCVHGVAREITNADDPVTRFAEEAARIVGSRSSSRLLCHPPREFTRRRLQASAGTDASWFPGIPARELVGGRVRPRFSRAE